MKVNRFEIYLVRLDPTLGSEMAKTRPCLVVSPDELAHYVRTVVVAPMTTTSKSYRSVFPARFGERPEASLSIGSARLTSPGSANSSVCSISQRKQSSSNVSPSSSLPDLLASLHSLHAAT